MNKMPKNNLIRRFFCLALLICCISFSSVAITPCAAATSKKDDTRTLTVIMYHQILKKSRKSAYVVTPDCFEDDLKEISARGYTTVLPREVFNFVHRGGSLPDKPLMITFDDGHYNNMYYGVPLLKKYGMKAVFNIVGKYTQNTVDTGDISKPAYSHLTWEQLKELAADKDFELGNHTYNLHDNKKRVGIARLKNESREVYKKILLDDVGRLQEIFRKECGVSPICFAYPFGKYSLYSRDLLVDYGFSMIFTCTQKNNLLVRKNAACLHDICRFNRSSFLSRNNFFDKF